MEDVCWGCDLTGFFCTWLNVVFDLAEQANHVWSYDFVTAWIHDGRVLWLRMLIDEYTPECLAILAARRIGAQEVIELLAEVMLLRGIPEHIRSDNGPAFTAKALREWLQRIGANTLTIEPGSPWGVRGLRELQQQAQGRVAQRGALLQPEGSAHRDRCAGGANTTR